MLSNHSWRQVALYTAAGIYGLSLLDDVLFHPRGWAGTGGASLDQSERAVDGGVRLACSASSVPGGASRLALTASWR